MLDFIEELYKGEKEYATRKRATKVFADLICRSGLLYHKYEAKVIE